MEAIRLGYTNSFSALASPVLVYGKEISIWDVPLKEPESQRNCDWMDIWCSTTEEDICDTDGNCSFLQTNPLDSILLHFSAWSVSGVTVDPTPASFSCICMISANANVIVVNELHVAMWR